MPFSRALAKRIVSMSARIGMYMAGTTRPAILISGCRTLKLPSYWLKLETFGGAGIASQRNEHFFLRHLFCALEPLVRDLRPSVGKALPRPGLGVFHHLLLGPGEQLGFGSGRNKECHGAGRC